MRLLAALHEVHPCTSSIPIKARLKGAVFAAISPNVPCLWSWQRNANANVDADDDDVKVG